jgi:hypothetical protein
MNSGAMSIGVVTGFQRFSPNWDYFNPLNRYSSRSWRGLCGLTAGPERTSGLIVQGVARQKMILSRGFESGRQAKPK